VKIKSNQTNFPWRSKCSWFETSWITWNSI